MRRVLIKVRKFFFPYKEVPVVDLVAGAGLIDGRESSAIYMLDILFDNVVPLLEAIHNMSCKKDYTKIVAYVRRLHMSLAYCGTPRLSLITTDFIQYAKQHKYYKMRRLQYLLVREVRTLQKRYNYLKGGKSNF